MSTNAVLVEELNAFYALLEANNASVGLAVSAGTSLGVENSLALSEHEVRRALKRVITRKAAGPDG